jgi:hypothetical protein
MRTTLKLAVLVTVSLLLVCMGVFVYPLMQDAFERQYVDPSSVSDLEGGFQLDYDLPSIPYELASAALFVHSSNKTVRVYYLHDDEQERLSSGGPFEEVIISGNLSNLKEEGTDGAKKSYPDLSLTYWKPSTSRCAGLTVIFFLLFTLSALATAIYAVVTREPTKQDDEK